MTPSDLKNICNYSDKQMSQPKAQLMYIDMISTDDDEYQRKIKQQNRELVVDALLDDKVEELNIFRENNIISQPLDISSQYNPSSTMGIISPKIMQINLTAKKFETYEKVWNEVVDFLNQNTQSQKNLKNRNNSLDVNLQDDFDVDNGKIISKIMMCSNIIAMDGRIGPGSSFLYGKKLIPYIENNMNRFYGLEPHYSELIDDDKVIVCKANNIDQPGILLIDNSTTGHYFFDNTPNWDKQYCWFRII